MCAAHREKMTQKEGYVWFLPGWFDDRWYDIDELRLIKNRKKDISQLRSRGKEDGEFDDFTPSTAQGGTIQMFEDEEVGDLPDCSTEDMLVALDGHLSLVHSNYAPDDQPLRNNKTVSQWKTDLGRKILETKQEYHRRTHKKSKSNGAPGNQIKLETVENKTERGALSFNKYSGYVYDAVWLYALALEQLVSNSDTQSFIQNLHSEQTVEEFVKIIGNTDFLGVSGRINFFGRPSRLSEVKILQFSGYYFIFSLKKNKTLTFQRALAHFKSFKLDFTLRTMVMMRVCLEPMRTGK